MKIKRYILVLLVIFIVFSNFTINTWADDAYTIKHKPITITYNGEQIDCGEQAPELIGGRTMAPLRAVFEHIGCEVSYENGNISAVKGDEEVKLSIGNSEATVIRSGKTEKYILDEAPTIINGRTLVPVRFIAEAIGCKINWNPIMREAVIIDVNEWKDKMKNDAPLTDALFSLPISFANASASKKSGELNFSFNFKNIINPETNETLNSNIDVKITFDGKSQISNGNKSLEYLLGFEFTGLKSYADKLAASKEKEFFLTLLNIKKINLNAVLDKDYNLYLSGDGFNKLMTLCGIEQDNVAEKTLKIPLGQVISDLTAMPLGTILCSGSLCQGIEKTVSEDNTMFTQRVKLLDEFITLSINAFSFGESKVNETKDGLKTYQFSLDNAEFKDYISGKAKSEEMFGKFNLKVAKSLFNRTPYCDAKIIVKNNKIKNSTIDMSYGLNMVQDDIKGKITGNASYNWKFKMYGESINENKSVNTPEKYMNFDDFINSRGNILGSILK